MKRMLNNEIVFDFDDEKDENLTISIEKIGTIEGCLVIYLTGSIDTYNVNFFQKQVVKIIDSGYTKLIFHCGSLAAISSTGINSFSIFLNLVKSKGGNEVFCAIQPKVQEVFQVLDFDQAFIIKESLEASIDVFHGLNQKPIVLFPVLLGCPVCYSELNILGEGHFPCPKCNTALAIDNRAQIFLG